MDLTEKILRSLADNYEFIKTMDITTIWKLKKKLKQNHEMVQVDDITTLTIQEVLLYLLPYY